MKDNIHPEYKEVLFVDTATGKKFVCGSALQAKDTDEFEGKNYPVCRVSISSDSHPHFTQTDRVIDTEGRIKKFENRYKKKSKPSS